MSRTRLAVRILLVLLLVGVCWVAAGNWLRGSPQRYWRLAQRAMDKGNHEAAKLYLQNLLRDAPEHDQGYELMAEVLLLAEVTANDRLATLEDNVEARRNLGQAAELRPEDIELQKRLLDVYVNIGAMGPAANVAQRVVKIESNNADAVISLAWRAIDEKEEDQARHYLQQLSELSTPRRFLVAALKVQLDTDRDSAERRAALADAVRDAATIEDLSAMPLREQLILMDLIQLAIREADDVHEAHEISHVGLQLCEKAASQLTSQMGELANFASQIMSDLRISHPLDGRPGGDMTTRIELGNRADRFWVEAMNAGPVKPVIYSQSAAMAIARREPKVADEILTRGIAASQDLPASRSSELMQLHLSAARNLVVMRRYSDAKRHISILVSHKDYAGWGHLMSGAITFTEGRYETALKHYLSARQALGKIPLVQLGLGATYVELAKWEKALSVLADLNRVLEVADVEHEAWVELHEAYEADLNWKQARCYLALDRWEEAQVRLKSLDGTKLEPRARQAAAVYHWNKGRRDEALALLEKARETFPSDLRLLDLQAGFWRHSGRAKEADELIEQQLTSAGCKDFESQFYLAKWRIRQRRVDDAISLLIQLEECHPDRVEPSFLKARLLLAMNRPREAVVAAERLRESQSSQAVRDFVEALADLQEKNLTGAYEKLSEVNANLPSASPRLSLLQGQIAAASGDYASAVESVEDSLDVTSIRGQAQTTLLRSLLLLAQQDGPAEASEVLERLLKEHTDDAFLWLIQAELHFKRGKFQDGVRALDRFEQLDSRKPTGAYVKSLVWWQAGDVRRSVEEVQRALQIDGKHVASHVLAAQLQLAAQQFWLSLQHTQAALLLDPQQWHMYLVQAQALNRLGSRSDAIRVLEDVLTMQPRFWAAHRDLAATYRGGGEYENALRAYRRAREHIPEVFLAVVGEISALCQLGRLEEAHSVAVEAVGEPANFHKCLAISQGFDELDLLTQAREWGHRALEVANDSQEPIAHGLLGQLAWRAATLSSRQDMLEAARDHFAAASAANPDDLTSANNLAWLLAARFNEVENALPIVERIHCHMKDVQLSPYVLDTIAMVYRKAGKLDAAREVLETALRRNQNEPMLLCQMGLVLADLGRRTAAREMLQRSLTLGGLDDEHVAEVEERLLDLARDEAIVPLTPVVHSEQIPGDR